METTSTDRFSWRDVYRLETGKTGHWQIGPFRMWARRHPREWFVSFAREPDSLRDTGSVQIPGRTEPEGNLTSRRFGVREPPAEIRLTPGLAERPVVTTPEEPFLLAPKEETTLYVSTPVWIGVEVGEPPVKLLDEASRRPSDTWFGESTRTGELCYATRTRATLERANLPARVHRALSVVHIRNRVGSLLGVEKLKLPAPNMSLFLDSDGHLWTEELTLDRIEEGRVAAVVLASGPPASAGDVDRVAGPRKKLEKGFLDRTFGGLMRELRG
jgi:hypothetical protein